MSSKTRNWWFILYPESAPEDWLNTLQSTLVPFALSPLHDKDINDDGSLKKPHYHVLLRYDGPTTYNHVLELTRSLNQPIPTRYDSFSGAYAYLYHGNSPDKFQYESASVVRYNGLSVPSSRSESGDMLRRVAVLSFIDDNDIREYADLVDYVVSSSNEEWLKEISRNCYFYLQYIKSRHYRSVSQLESIKAKVFDEYASFFRETQKPVPQDIEQI